MYYSITYKKLNPIVINETIESSKDIDDLWKYLESNDLYIHNLKRIDFEPKTKRWQELEILIFNQQQDIDNLNDLSIKDMKKEDLKSFKKILKFLINEDWYKAEKIYLSLDTSPRSRIPENVIKILDILCR